MPHSAPSKPALNRPRLILVCGLPGAGKTTHARALEDKLHAVRFSPDEWMSALAIDLYDEPARSRIEQLQWSFCERLLTLGLAVIVEWGTWSRAERDALRDRAHELGAAAELHYLFAPEEVLFERVRNRGMENPPIERESLARWFRQFEAPSREEKELYDRVEEIEGAAE
jgi:predicted kinase